MSTEKFRNLEQVVRGIDYAKLADKYIPSVFALEYLNFIKLVNGGGEENSSPVIHYKMLDAIARYNDVLIQVFRGAAKSTLIPEYGALYLATYGKYPLVGKVPFALYVSDTIENGIRNMRKNLEYRWQNSAFLQEVVPEARFNETEWVFKNINNQEFTMKGLGVNSSLRGIKAYGQRPRVTFIDDLLSDKTAEQPNILEVIEKLVYHAIRPAMHPKYKKIIWTGTPFNQKDPITTSFSKKEWHALAFPICDKFPCEKKDFHGAWEDRFPFEVVEREYNIAKSTGNIHAFNKELMLRITSDEDRLVLEEDIVWYENREQIVNNKDHYHWYITTDFATSEKEKSDFSVISVWAIDSNGVYYWVDGTIKRQNMDKNIDDLFMLVESYNPLSVGIEISGQQKGFISWIDREMQNREIWFQLAKDKKGQERGLRPTTSKLARFNVALPLFKQRKIRLPKNFTNATMIYEMVDELENITTSGFKSMHDDFIDTISQLPLMKCVTPNNGDLSGSATPELDPSINKYYKGSTSTYSSGQEDNYFV